MQKPPGVGNPASPSLARFAALGPTRSGSVAARSLSGRMKRVIQNSFGLLAAHSLSPRAGRGSGEGASPLGADLRRSESRRGPLTLGRYAPSTSPRAAGRGEFHLT